MKLRGEWRWVPSYCEGVAGSSQKQYREVRPPILGPAHYHIDTKLILLYVRTFSVPAAEAQKNCIIPSRLGIDIQKC